MEKIEYQREEYVRDIYCPICNAEIGVFRWEINRELLPR